MSPTNASSALGAASAELSWLQDPLHRAWLLSDAKRQLNFFQASLAADGSFDLLDWQGKAQGQAQKQAKPRSPQELHTTTRLVHSFALGKAAGFDGCEDVIDAGMAWLWHHHRDAEQGGYHWAVSADGPVTRPGQASKLAYGHVFVLLAASSALQVGHPDAHRLLDDIRSVIDQRFWDPAAGRLSEEYQRDWSAFSSYRGMNANMHGTEAFLAAYEATGEAEYLQRAGQILDFFLGEMAANSAWRIPEHYREDWRVDPDYQGDPMFRPYGTTPGHSLEFARLALQYWDLCGRPSEGTASQAPAWARSLTQRALADAWRADGGLVYTLSTDGGVSVPNRYWWPVTEGIGALAALLKLAPDQGFEDWYRRLWRFAEQHFVDSERGGWFPELDARGRPSQGQFVGKPDLYHALQATLLPLLPGLSRPFEDLRGLSG